MDMQFLPDDAPPTQLEMLVAARFKAVEQQHWTGIASVFHDAREAFLVFRMSQVQCRGDSCSCLVLQACLQRLLERAAELPPQLGILVDLKAHMCMPTYYSYIPDCPHAAATRLAVAEAYYKLIALPDYNSRAAAAAAAAAAPAATACDADIDRRIEHCLCAGKGLNYPPAQRQALQSQWAKVLRRLQKAEEALPPNNQPLSPANASKLSMWIFDGPKGINSKMDGLLQPSHTVILWAAAACRVCRNNLFTTDIAGDFLRPAAGLAAALLDVTCTMGRLSAAGISFNTQPSPAAVAAALDLAAQVNAALMPFQYKRMLLKEKEEREQRRQQQQQHTPLPLLPLYLSPLQQQQEEAFKQTVRAAHVTNQYEDIIIVPAQGALHEPRQFWSLGVPVICVHASRLLHHWEQQLKQQQQQQEGVEPAAPGRSDAVAGCGASCGGSSSSSSRSAWQEAEGMLLLGAAVLEGSCRHYGQQHLQQQLALCRHYQQQFQQAAAQLGLSNEMMAAVAAWFTKTEQFSSSSGSSSSSSEGAAAGSDAAADCLAVVVTAALLCMLVFPLVDPKSQTAEQKQPLQGFTAAEKLLVAGFFRQAPGLLSAAAVAAVMQTQPVGAAAAAAAAIPWAVLSQLPMVVHTLRLYGSTRPSLSQLLHEELTPAQRAVTAGLPLQQQQQQHSRKQTPSGICAMRMLLGSSSILLQRLLRMAPAAAAAAAADTQQQLLLRAAIVFFADALAEQAQGFWRDLRANEVLHGVDDCFLLYSNQNATTLARAVQVLETAVRHLLSAVPPGDVGSTMAVQAPAAAGSAMPAGSSSGSSSSSCRYSSRPVQPTIRRVQEAAIGMYGSLINHASGYDGSSCSSCRDLSCLQQQLLQAALSLLLTASKLWQAGRQPPVPLEALRYLASKAALHMQLVAEKKQPVNRPPGVPTSAAVAATLEAAGGVQVCHVVTRYLGCCEQQLRQRVASGDAVGAAKWLCGPYESTFPLPSVGPATAAASGSELTRLQALCSVVQTVSALAPVGDAGGEAVQQRFRELYYATAASVAALLTEVQGGGEGGEAGSTTPLALRRALLASLREWADGLKSFGSALVASLPSRFGCNWPGCVRLSGVSEGYGLVRGQACVCGGCRQARYCSVSCQAAHWPAHKAFCQQHRQQQPPQQTEQPPEQQAAAAAMEGPCCRSSAEANV